MKSNCPTQLVLQGFFYEGKMTDEVGDHVSRCSACQAKVAQWASNREAFLARYPFEKFWMNLEARRKKISFWEKFLIPAPLRTALALASVAVLMVFAIWKYQQPPEIRTKGGVGLGFYVSESGKVVRGRDEMSLPPGSDLQFIYSTEKDPYLLLLGVETDGTLNVYYPHEGTASALVEPGKKKQLPQALRWQPKDQYERFYALFSENPVSREEAEGALKGLLKEGKSIEQTERFPLPYPQVSILVYRKNAK